MNQEEKDMQLEEKAKKMASAIKEELGLDKLNDAVKNIQDQLTAKQNENVMKVLVAKGESKELDKLESQEKAAAFAIALITNNDVTLKALSEGVDADGGYTVPQDFYNRLLSEMMEATMMRSQVTVLPMSRNTIDLTMIDHGPDVYWTAEGATKTTTTADFSRKTLTAYKLASIIYLTDELIDDSAFNLVDVLVNRFASKMAEWEDRAIVNGAGTTQPTGIFANASVSTRACSGNLDFDDIIDLIYDLPVKFRANAKFILHPNNVREIRKLKDGNGRYLWQDAVAPGQPATIYGYPVLENYWAPESQIAFGDYKEGYWLGDRQRVTVKITNDTETTFTQDKTGIRVVERIAGDVVFPNAIRKLITIP